jgi:hypothetical protein
MSRALAVAVLTCAACTIDNGAVPDAAPCAANPDFFVSDVYPKYLVANQCGTGGCHDFDDGHGSLRLHAPEPTPPSPGLGLGDWPIGWRENYLSTIQLLRCDAPAQSRLLLVPEGISNLHPPGPVVLDRAAAAAMLQAWVAP